MQQQDSNSALISSALLQHLSKMNQEAEEGKKRKIDMNDFLKDQILRTIKRKLNAFLTTTWNKFLIYDVCLTPMWSYEDLVHDLPLYKIPSGAGQPTGIDGCRIHIIETKDVFEAFFNKKVETLTRKSKNGCQICFFLPFLIMYRPGMQKIFIGMKKAPKTKAGVIGRLVKCEFKKTKKKNQ